MAEHILIVDDEETFRKVLCSVFEEAAKMLGIGLSSLYRKMEELDITS